MAKNYKLDLEKDIIYVDLDNLTESETKEVQKLRALGYKPVPKRKNNAKTPKNEHFKKWFKENGKKEEEKLFEAKKNEKIIDKNGKERKGGYLLAMKWFRDKYPEEYKAIKDSVE